MMIEDAEDKRIVVTSNLFKYLEKYNFEVISLDENETNLDKNVAIVKNMISDGSLKYIYTIKNEDVNETVTSVIDGTEIKLLEFHAITNLSDEERNSKKDYLTIMNDNVELLKQQLYE